MWWEDSFEGVQCLVLDIHNQFLSWTLATTPKSGQDFPIPEPLRPFHMLACMFGRCHHLLSGFYANGNLPRVSRQLIIRVIMSWYLELCRDFLAFTLQLRKTLRTSARRPSVKAVRSVNASKGVGRIAAQHVRERERERNIHILQRIYVIYVRFCELHYFAFKCVNYWGKHSFSAINLI